MDPLLDSLTILEANNVRVRTVLVRARRAFKRFFGNFFPKQKEPEDLLNLADVFNAEKDPALDYRQAATKTGVEVAMVMAMVHGENVDWDKVSSSFAVDDSGKPKILVYFLKSAKKFSKKMIPLIQPASASAKESSGAIPSASATPSEYDISMVLLLPSLDDWVDPEFASGPSRQESMPEESSTSEAADPTTQSSKPSPGTGGTHHFEELQSELRILKDQIVVALSKVKRAAKREDYLLDLIFRASDDLLCVQLNPVTETERIKARMNVHMEISVGTGSDFWTDHKRCFNIVQLQDRVSQVSEFVEFRRSVLAMIYNTMFPRNPEPQGFAELVGKFKHAEDIHYFVKIQLVAGAKLALAWVRVH